MRYWTPQEVAAEAREAFARNPETPEQTWDRMIRAGFSNKRGEVTKLLGGDADPEPHAENKLPEKKRRSGLKASGLKASGPRSRKRKS